MLQGGISLRPRDDERIVVLSVTEGEDKPAKYPLAFNTAHTMILNKTDLLPHLDYNMKIVMEDLKKINPNMIAIGKRNTIPFIVVQLSQHGLLPVMNPR